MEDCITFNADGVSACKQYSIPGTVTLKCTRRREGTVKLYIALREIDTLLLLLLSYSPVNYKGHLFEHVVVDGKYILEGEC